MSLWSMHESLFCMIVAGIGPVWPGIIVVMICRTAGGWIRWQLMESLIGENYNCYVFVQPAICGWHMNVESVYYGEVIVKERKWSLTSSANLTFHEKWYCD